MSDKRPAFTDPPRVLSGIQPSGNIHLGNYFGAIAQYLKLQEEFAGECYFFIADYHALTTVHDGDTLREGVRDAAATHLALGLDPAKMVLFRQSDIPEVTELTWLLSSVTGMGLLERAHSFKDKVAKGIRPSMGLFNYPILMAADILIYRSSVVPVGKDQVQHVEMTQDMATYFNESFCKKAPILRRPEFRLSATPKVPGLDGAKMSKSYGNTIPVFASGKALKKTVGRIVTDSKELGSPLDPESCNVFALLSLFCREEEKEELAAAYRAGAREGQPFGYGHAKQMLVAKMDEAFGKARAAREHWLNNPKDLDAVLESGAEKARKLARETIDACKVACGLR